MFSSTQCCFFTFARFVFINFPLFLFFRLPICAKRKHFFTVYFSGGIVENTWIVWLRTEISVVDFSTLAHAQFFCFVPHLYLDVVILFHFGRTLLLSTTEISPWNNKTRASCDCHICTRLFYLSTCLDDGPEMKPTNAHWWSRLCCREIVTKRQQNCLFLAETNESRNEHPALAKSEKIVGAWFVKEKQREKSAKLTMWHTSSTTVFSSRSTQIFMLTKIIIFFAFVLNCSCCMCRLVVGGVSKQSHNCCCCCCWWLSCNKLIVCVIVNAS